MRWRPFPASQASTCHPFRRDFRAGRCRECCQVEGVLGLGLGRLPAVVVGVERAGRIEIPARCRCGAGPPAWVIGEAYAHCFICGRDCFRLDAEQAIPAPVAQQRPRGARAAAHSASR